MAPTERTIDGTKGAKRHRVIFMCTTSLLEPMNVQLLLSIQKPIVERAGLESFALLLNLLLLFSNPLQ